MAALAAGIPALPAAAIGIGGSAAFGLTPARAGTGAAASYFSMTIAAGQSAGDTVIISNQGTTSEKLDVGRSLGVTAPNGGGVYGPANRRCSGPACWLTGLPSSVTLAPGTRELLHFSVAVPAGTADGQYLAGITAEPAVRPAPVQVGSNGKARAQAVIVEQVTVGVAVTVGNLSQLQTQLQVPGVNGEAIGPMARLNIQLRNTGQTFSGGKATASCTAAGHRRSYTVFTNLILPDSHAQIAVDAPGLPEGSTVPCSVLIRYGKGLTVRWSGMVALPGTPATRIVHTGPGTYAVVPVSGIPGWAIALLITGGLVLAAVLLLFLLLLRARRHRPTA